MIGDPTVAIAPPRVAGVVLPGSLMVSCTACGDVAEVELPPPLTVEVVAPRWAHARLLARRHADGEHDGLVLTDGWVR